MRQQIRQFYAPIAVGKNGDFRNRAESKKNNKVDKYRLNEERGMSSSFKIVYITTLKLQNENN